MKLSLNKKIIISQIISVLFLSLPFSFVYSASMSSGNYSIERDSMNFGGSHTTGSSRIIEDSIGEVGTGDISGTNYKINSGYQQSNVISSSDSGSSGSNNTSSSLGSHRGSVNVLNFQANPINESINLTWQYPFQANIDSVRIIRSTKFFPTNLEEGEIIFEGNSNSIIDNNVKKGITYYYAIFAKNSSGIYSSGVLAQSLLPKNKNNEVNLNSNQIFDSIPSAIDVNPIIKKLSFIDFDFFQDSISISNARDIIPIDGSKPLTISLDYKKVPETLKTIAISISDVDNPNKIFTFLLRVNKDKTAYEATIGSLGKNGEYKVNAIVLDYKNQSLRRFNGVLKASVFDSAGSIIEKNNFDLNINYKLVAIIVVILALSITIGIFVYRKHNENIRNRNIFISIILILSFIFTPFAQAAINKQINYQGRLTNSSNTAVSDGSYSMVFKLYTTSTGGSPIWTETLNGGNKVQVTNGLFSVMLGAVDTLSSVDFNQTLYLGVDIEGDGEMSPRKIIGAVPSAFVADTLDGLDSTQFLRSDAGSVSSGYFIATTTTSSIFPYASTTAISANTICISSDCRTMWPSSGGTGGGTWSTTTSNVSGQFVNYSNNNSDIVAIGSNSTTSAKYYFDPNTQTASIGGRLTMMYSSSTVQTISGNLYLGTLNGPLQANNGLVTATTSVGVVYGGTGLTTSPSYGNILVGNALGGYTLTATSSLGIAVGSPFPFTNTLFGSTNANSTSTLIGFTNGIYSLASSTIGNGNQNGGLTISGGATTTGSVYVGGSVGIGISNPTSQFQMADGTSFLSIASGSYGYTLSMGQSGFSRFTVSDAGDITLRHPSGSPTITGGSTSAIGLTIKSTSGAGTSDYIRFLVGNNGNNEALNIISSGNIGIGTSSPYTKLSVVGQVVGAYFTATTSTASIFPYASTTAISANTICIVGDSCRTSWPTSGSGSSFSFPFTNTLFGSTNANSTSTLIGFTNGIYSLASSTIGNGNQNGGLTISGGATTTGSLYVGDTTTIYSGLNVGTTSSSLHAAGAQIKTSYESANSGSEMSLYTAGAFVGRSGLSLIRSLGTINSPSAVVQDNSLGFLGFKGYDGSGTQLSALVEGFVDGDVSVGSVPSRLSFVTGSNGSNRAERLTVKNNGLIGVGSTTPRWMLQVASTTASPTMNGQFALTDAGAQSNLKHWVLSSNNGNLFVATSSDAFATSSISALTVNKNGFLGIGTTSPSTILSLGDTAGINLSTATSSFSGTGGINLASGCFAVRGVCVGSNTTSSSGATFAFPFTASLFGSTASNATSTLIGFTSGIYSLASSTIGNGNQNGGLTISGGATTTGNAYFGGNVGVGTTTTSQKLEVSDGSVSITSANGQGRGLILSSDVMDDTSRPSIKFLRNNFAAFLGDDHTTQTFNFMTALNSTRTFSALVRAYGSETGGFNNYSGLTHDGTDGSITTGFGDLVLSPATFKVGIGTSSPATELNIAATLPEITLSDTDATTNQKHWFIEGDSGVFSIGTTSDQLVKTATRALSISAAGNIGVGTTTPSAKLDIYNNAGTNTGLFVDGGASGVTIAQFARRSGAVADLKINASSGDPQMVFSSNNTDAFSMGYDVSNSSFNISASPGVGTLDRFVVKGANIGIGTTSPYATLSVAGQVVGAYFTATTTTASTFPYASTTAISANTICISTDCRTSWPSGGSGSSFSFPFTASLFGSTASNATSTLIGFTSGIYSLASSTIGNGNQNGGLTISGGATTTGNAYFGGNVGVGTSSPYAALSVAGASGILANVYSATSTTATSTFAGGLNVGSGNLVYDLNSGVTSALALQTGNLNFENDAGLVSWTDLQLTSASPNDTPQGYTAFLNGSSTISVYGLSNGNGYLQSDYPRVAIGSTTVPTSKLTVFANGSGTNSVFETLNSSNTSLLKVLESGSVGIGSSTPWRKLSVVGTVALNGLTSSATGNAVCISTSKDITDAGGASCTPSSIRFKENVTPLASGYALDELSKLSVVNFDYIEKQEFETNKSYGLIAEEVEKIDKNLVDYGYDGKPLSLHFEKITGLLIQAVQEQQKQIKDLSLVVPSSVLSSNVSSSVTPSSNINTLISSSTLDLNSEIISIKNELYNLTSSSTLMLSIASSTLDMMSNSLASTTADRLVQSESFISIITSSIIDNLSNVVLNLKSVFVKEIHVEEKLCVDDVCVNKDQLKAMLINAGAGHTTTLISNPIPPSEDVNQNTNTIDNNQNIDNSNNTGTSTINTVIDQAQTPTSTSTPTVISTIPSNEQNNNQDVVVEDNQNNGTQSDVVNVPSVQEQVPVDNP